MCGIAGFVSNNARIDWRATLRSMSTAISHRGPDDEGFYETTTQSHQFNIGLAHRRLSIIDLDAGHQPIGNEDGSIQIVFNGEIYNFQELRDRLISFGHKFSTNSDTETIIHAYEEYGTQCTEHLRGMFAFAIWDSNCERLFLARDRFGKKPLFFHENNSELLFASEIKSLLQHPDVEKQVNRNAVWDYLAYRYVPAPLTLFKGIQKLLPGHCAIWENGKLNQWSYYTPKDCLPPSNPNLRTNIVEEFLANLDEAVRIRMVSDVPFGAFLSGGIDSSAIVGLMTKHSQLPIKTFSVGFKESAYSELDYAKVIADQFKTDHHELTISQQHIMDKLPELVRFRDAPVAEPSDIPIYLLSKEARKTVKMVLTGEGSDEFLGGYPKHVFERYVGMYQYLPSFIRSGLFEPLIQALPYKFRRIKTAVHNMGLEDWHERMARWFGALSYAQRISLTSYQFRNSIQPADSALKICKNNSLLRNILCFDQNSWLPDNLLERGDRMTMAASLEARMPFMDHQLAEFISTLPDNMRVRGKTTKWILREAMKQLLPVKILERPKVGFRVPINEWFKNSMRDYLYDHLTGTASITRNYYDKSTLNKILQEHVNGRQNHEKLLWTLLTLEIWHREYSISA